MASPKDSRLASFPSHSAPCPRTTSILHNTELYVCMCGEEHTLLSNFSLPGLPQTPEGTQTISTQHKPGSKALLCASYLPCPEILTWCSKLLSLLHVAQVPIFSCKKSSLLRVSWHVTERCCPVGVLGDLSETTPRALLGQVTCSA